MVTLTVVPRVDWLAKVDVGLFHQFVRLHVTSLVRIAVSHPTWLDDLLDDLDNAVRIDRCHDRSAARTSPSSRCGALAVCSHSVLQ